MLDRNTALEPAAALSEAASRLSDIFTMQALLNGGFGLFVAIALWILGVPNALLWGVATALLRFVPFIGAIAPNLVDFAYIVLGMAMAALGINVNFKAIASKGKKPMLASFLTSILLMCFAAGVAMLFF